MNFIYKIYQTIRKYLAAYAKRTLVIPAQLISKIVKNVNLITVEIVVQYARDVRHFSAITAI